MTLLVAAARVLVYRYIAAAKGYLNGADQTVRGKKAAIAREWGLCLLEGGQFAAGDAGVYEGVRQNVDYHIQRLDKALPLAPPAAAASAFVPAFTPGAPSCRIAALQPLPLSLT